MSINLDNYFVDLIMRVGPLLYHCKKVATRLEDFTHGTDPADWPLTKEALVNFRERIQGAEELLEFLINERDPTYFMSKEERKKYRKAARSWKEGDRDKRA